MNKLTQTLLAGTALCALATVPATAKNHFGLHVTALHGEHAVNKTKMPNHGAAHITYTFAVSTSVPASDLNTRVKLTKTFYRWSSYDSCYFGGTEPKMKIKAPKRSNYAKLRTAIESYSLGCPFGPSHFYGDTYKLNDAAGFGQTDTFVSTLYGWFRNGSTKYKGTLHLDVSVAIGD